MTLTGTNYQTGATVTLGGTAATGVTVVSSTSITATTPAHAAGAVNVVVTNTDTQSGTLANGFTYTNPVPSITSLNPSSVAVGSATFTLTVNGTSFVNGATVQVNGSARTTTFVSSTQVTASIPASDVATTGSLSITVVNPTPGGGTSGTATLTVNNPPPTITSLNPSTVAVGSATFTLTVNGTSFVNGATVQVNGSARTTTFVGSTQVTASIPASDVAIAGTLSITVVNPTPGGGTSGTATLTVNNPPPTITSISPNSGSYAGGTSVTITGSNYQAGATVTLGETAATGVTVASSASITATTPAHAVGAVNVVVTNPDSQSATLTNGYTYTNLSAPPTVTAISPSSGLNNAAVSINSITGTNFALGWDKENGLVSNWRMDETNGSTLADSSGNGNNGTAGGTTIVAGKIGNGRSFNGSSDYVDLGNPANMNFGSTDSYSIALWVKSNAVTPTQQEILSKDNIAGNQRIHLYIQNGTLYRWDGSGSGFAGPTISSNDGWTYVVYTYSTAGTNSGTETFYKNGVQVSTRTGSMPAPENGVNWNLGRSSYSTGYWYFNGSIDEVRIYNRVLSAAEVQALYNATIVPSITLTKSGQSNLTCTGFTNTNSTTLSSGTCNITAAATGTWNVVLTDADQQSATLPNGFTISSPPAPTVTSILPTSGTTNGGTSVTITGTGFLNGATVSLGGTSATGITVVSSTSITATTAAHAAGAVNVVVTNTDSQSATLTNGFTYTNPLPTITSLNPSSVAVGSATFTLTVNGTSFVNSATVQVNGSARTTTFVSSTQVTASIPVSDVAIAGTLSITVVNPTPGGGTSNTATLTVATPNPVPAISTISPTNVTAGSAGFTLTVNGSNFVGSSVVRWNGSNRTTTFVSAAQLTAQIPSSDVTNAGTVTITVYNPAPGGGASNSATFTVNALNYSLSLDGSSSAGAMDFPPSSLAVSGSITVEAWIKTSVIPSFRYPSVVIVNRCNGTFCSGYGLFLRTSGTYGDTGLYPQFQIMAIPGYYSGSVPSTVAVNDGQWHHVAGVLDSNFWSWGGNFRIYVDGVLRGSFGYGGSLASDNSFLTIGNADSYGSLTGFNGLIDEVRVTASGIYGDNFTPLHHLTSLTNTVGLWKFDGLSTLDSTSFHNNLTLFGNATFSPDTP